jgi:L-methionine (R)-S-oxide reductase
MPIIVNNTLNLIRSLAMGGDDRAVKGKRLAERIQTLGNYRWVGVYDVNQETVSLIAWFAPGAPEAASFPATHGLTSAAIAQKKTVIVGDVRTDPRCQTAFSNTLSEMVVPVVSPDGRVIGAIDVESERANAFSASDQQMIEQCAEAALPMWLLR